MGVTPIREFKNSKLTRKKIAGILGVAPITVWRWRNEGMPSYKYRTGTYYVLKDTLDWMKCQPKKMELYITIKMKLEE